MSCLKVVYFSIDFTACYLPSNISAGMDKGRGLLSKKWTGGGRRLNTGKNVQTSFKDDPLSVISWHLDLSIDG